LAFGIGLVATWLTDTTYLKAKCIGRQLRQCSSSCIIIQYNTRKRS